MVGKQTWKGAKEGYTSKKAPEYKGSPGKLNSGTSKGGKQKVKGK